MSNLPAVFPYEDNGGREELLVNKFSVMVKGLPPPSSITISRLTVEEMLMKYKENLPSFLSLDKSDDYSKSMPVSLPVYYLNSSEDSEEIATLSQKVQERYIHSETMSSCNIWFESSIPLTNSARKRYRARKGLSPGRRLSHLAKRRQVFSCANLQQMADKRHVLEVKKNGLQRGKSQNFDRNIQEEKLKTSKRSLFLSPDDEPPKLEPMVNKNIPKRKLFTSSEKKPPPEEISKKFEGRMLAVQNFQVEESKKRWRDESASDSDRKRKCPRRSLTFTEEDSSKSPVSDSTHSTCSDDSSSASLSQKLLWAVSVSLQEKCISRKEPSFKACASALFMLCRKNLYNILNSKTGNGTSEKMLHFARQHLPDVLVKLKVETKDSSNIAECKSSKNSEDPSESNNKSIRGILYPQPGKENSEYINKQSENLVHKKDRTYITPKKVSLVQKKADTCSKISRKIKLHKKILFRSRSFESLCNNKLKCSFFDESEESNSLFVARQFLFEKSKNINVKLGYRDFKSVNWARSLDNLREVTIEHSPVASSVQNDTSSPPNLYPALANESIGSHSSFSDVEYENNISNQDQYLKDYLQYRNILEQYPTIDYMNTPDRNQIGAKNLCSFTSPVTGWDIKKEDNEPELAFQAYISSELIEFEKLKNSDDCMNSKVEGNANGDLMRISNSLLSNF